MMLIAPQCPGHRTLPTQRPIGIQHEQAFVEQVGMHQQKPAISQCDQITLFEASLGERAQEIGERDVRTCPIHAILTVHHKPVVPDDELTARQCRRHAHTCLVNLPN